MMTAMGSDMHGRRVEPAVPLESDQDGLSRARGFGLAVCLSAMIWGALAVIRLTLW